jgi:hypothetical protein
MEGIIEKILIFIFCFCSLNIIREIYTFYECFVKLETYSISNLRMIGFWACISYILTIICTSF